MVSTVKTIGLLGGMSWESSIEYERRINEGVRAALGGTASADLIIRSYNFAAVEALQEAGDWNAAGRLLACDAQQLEAAGADMVLLCTNTMHVVASVIEDALSVPFLHLADTTADAVLADGLTTVALLGTRYTMEEDFYRGRLIDAGLSVLVPDEPDLTDVHRVIYDELVQGKVVEASKQRYLEVTGRLAERGAQGIIAGCTEIELLVRADDLDVPFYPTAQLHAEAAVRIALEHEVNEPGE